ncbi:MAG: hypothetical protein ACRDJP_01710 [Actinomycetota bacterium]
MFDDLPGVTAECVADWVGGRVAIRVVQDFGESSPPARRRLVGMVGVPTSMLDDLTLAQLQATVEAQLGELFRPWLFPDPELFPVLVLFPRMARAGAWLRHMVRR